MKPIACCAIILAVVASSCKKEPETVEYNLNSASVAWFNAVNVDSWTYAQGDGDTVFPVNGRTETSGEDVSLMDCDKRNCPEIRSEWRRVSWLSISSDAADATWPTLEYTLFNSYDGINNADLLRITVRDAQMPDGQGTSSTYTHVVYDAENGFETSEEFSFQSNVTADTVNYTNVWMGDSGPVDVLLSEADGVVALRFPGEEWWHLQ